MTKQLSRIEDNIRLLRDFNLNDSDIKYLGAKSKNIREEATIISFDVFLEKDSRTTRTSFHFFFNANTNNIKTAQYIKSNNKEFFKFDVYIYLLRKKANSNPIVESIRRVFSKKELDKTMNLRSVDFASDIVKRISKIKSDLKFEPVLADIPKAFINPTIDTSPFLTETNSIQKTTKATKEYVIKWFENKEKPIMVVLGKGGVGKTTITEYFSNMIIEEFKNTSNIFIDSVEIRHRLSNSKNDTYLSLYDLYRESIKEQNVIDEYYFAKNLDFNNFFIIIDGIDELISKVPNFDINNFIDSIISYNSQIESTKIIISCRSEYWNIDRSNIQLIELMAFDKSQMENFFNKSFSNDYRKVNRAIDLAIDFHRRKETKEINIYHPYALDLITSIIRQDIHLKEDLDTTHLNTDFKTDYIIAKMCFRERFHSGLPRVTNLSIDEQVKILEYIAIVHNGVIQHKDLNEAVFFGINKNNNDNVQEIDFVNYAISLLSHPLLKYDKITNIVTFAYDFYTDVFKGIYLAYNLKNENLLEEVKVELLSFIAEFKFGSQITLDIKNRVSKWDDCLSTNLFLFFEIIEENRTLDPLRKIDLFAGLFNIAYLLFKSFNNINKIENIKLLEKIGIKTGNEIRNLCLVDIIEDRLVFDFTDISVFRNCVFSNFSSFWDVSTDWNENTVFINCTFKSLGTRNSLREIKWIIDNGYKNFDINSQKNMDDEFKEQIKTSGQIVNELKIEVSKLIKSFLNFFWGAPNSFHSQNFNEETQNCRYPFTKKYSQFSSLPIKVEDFINICETINIIEYSYYNSTVKKININSSCRSDIKKYIQTADKPKIIEDLENEILLFLKRIK